MMMSKLFSLAEFWYLEGHTQKRMAAGMKARTNLRFSTENTRRATKKRIREKVFPEYLI